MATLFNTLFCLFRKPQPTQDCGPVTAALRALQIEFGDQA